MSGEEWYTNKELLEITQALKHEMEQLRSEIKQTTQVIHRYNGLREDLGTVCQRVSVLETTIEAKYRTWEGIRVWGGWIIATAAFLYTVFGR